MVAIVIDAGTTNVRISLLSRTGELLSQFRSDAGVRWTAIDGNNTRLCAAVKEGIAHVLHQQNLSEADVDYCVAYGMITSSVGLCEIPHLAAPATPTQFHAGLVTRAFPELASFPITFIPGLRNFSGAVTLENAGQMDMMRGEETEAVGLWQAMQPDSDMVLVLPGSHNKFIAMGADGTLRGCMTSISGELLDALTHHSLLTSTVQGEFATAESYDQSMMLAGARACGAGLGRAAFTTRILQTLGDFSVAQARSFLLGAVLRLDLQALESFQLFDASCTLYVAGKPPLSTALCDLLSAHAYKTILVPEEVRSRMGLLGATTIYGGDAS